MADQSAFLRTAVDIGHLGARVAFESEFLEAAADLLHHNFELVAVQVYLVDAAGLFGELRQHAGAGDRRLIMRTPGVPVGADSELGAVLAGDKGHALRDMSGLPRNAVPMEARRGMVLPLIVEGKVLGAMVLYASELEAMMMADPGPFVSLADMVALALESVRQREQARREAMATPKKDVTASSAQQVPVSAGKSVAYSLQNREGPPSSESFSTPITMRGSVIGSMSFRGASKEALGPEELELIESVSDQVGQAIENLSLLEDAQRIARREQLINEITGQLQRATSVDDVLRTAAEAVRQALGDVEVTARLSPEAIASGGWGEAGVDGNEAT